MAGDTRTTGYELGSEDIKALESLGQTNPKAMQAIVRFGENCYNAGAHASISGGDDAAVNKMARGWIQSHFPNLTTTAFGSNYASQTPNVDTSRR